MRPRFLRPRSKSWPWLLVGGAILLLIALLLQLRRPGTPVSESAAAHAGQWASDTGDPATVRVYESAARRGLTAEDVLQIEETAKAAEPPYGLIRGHLPKPTED